MRAEAGGRRSSGPCVYFVLDANRPGVCKVGVSKNLSSRLKQLRSQLRRSLFAKRVVYCRNMSTARSLESLLHRKLAGRKADIGPEWFSMTAAEIGDLVSWADASYADASAEGYEGCLQPEAYRLRHPYAPSSIHKLTECA